MARPRNQLLIISRDTLLDAEHSDSGPGIFRHLAKLTRKGRHLLLTAPEPDKWFPTRGNVDDVLTTQSRLQQLIQESGGDLDGVYYVPRSLFTQDRNRRGALQDILRRFGVKPGQATLISGSSPFIKAADSLNMETWDIPEGDDAMTALERAILQID